MNFMNDDNLFNLKCYQVVVFFLFRSLMFRSMWSIVYSNKDSLLSTDGQKWKKTKKTKKKI